MQAQHSSALVIPGKYRLGHASLPTELLSEVICCLSPRHQKCLLGVSRLFRDLVLPQIFQFITIFMLLGPHSTDDLLEFPNGSGLGDRSEAIHQKLMQRSWEVLDRICDDREFASSVKEMQLVVYTRECTCYDPEGCQSGCRSDPYQPIFEILLLRKAIGRLTNLRTFHLRGNIDRMTSVRKIDKLLPSGIHYLDYPSTEKIVNPKRFTCLTRLEYRRHFLSLEISDDDPDNRGPHEDRLHDFSLDIYPLLSSLFIDYRRIQTIPSSLAHNLATLGIVGSQESIEHINLRLVAQQFPHLKELTLLGAFRSTLCADFNENSKTLPALTSLRISQESPRAFGNYDELDFTADDGEGIYRFLECHSQLTRLFLRFQIENWETLEILLDAISLLPRLEVLGIHTGEGFYLDKTQSRDLIDRIPMHLRALHLVSHWNTHGEVGYLVEKLSKMPKLRFFHAYWIKLDLQVLAERLGYVEQVGVDHRICDIDRTSSGVKLVRWPLWKCRFPLESDFEDLDYAWLLKHY
ncbi:hypothetical protein NP233_g1208 [Leucocoprinus birnbaumii]|uniref:F-box domain-containing protein n=1 Tax=Leucocoprinus birnbaumii TaxID=56174 RepID=A0AAD5W1F9_9AGAR|nr:hypothetical protein NP233_g1208 [Leucocoprinus birnbaumii]